MARRGHTRDERCGHESSCEARAIPRRRRHGAVRPARLEVLEVRVLRVRQDLVALGVRRAWARDI